MRNKTWITIAMISVLSTMAICLFLENIWVLRTEIILFGVVIQIWYITMLMNKN